MKYCSNCGKQINDDALFCDGCGTPVKNEWKPEEQKNDTRKDDRTGWTPDSDPYARKDDYNRGDQRQTNTSGYWNNNVQKTAQNDGSAIGSLITGILSFFTCGLILGIVAIVLASTSTANNGGITPPYAKAGRICGIVSIILSVVVAFVYFILIFAGIAGGTVFSGII